MLKLFGRKEVYRSPSAEDAARAWAILRANGIPYAVTTKGAGTSLRRGLDVAIVSKAYNSAVQYGGAVDTPDRLYVIYVNREDFQRAAELIG